MEDSNFKTWKTTRHLILKLIENLSTDQLNKVPEGFSNNIIWNVGHIISAQQSLVYKASNLPMIISNSFYDRYKPGSKPDFSVSEEEINTIKFLLTSLIETTKNDYSNNKFKTYNSFITSLGYHIDSFETGFSFNNFHEAMHLGYIKALLKLV